MKSLLQLLGLSCAVFGILLLCRDQMHKPDLHYKATLAAPGRASASEVVQSNSNDAHFTWSINTTDALSPDEQHLLDSTRVRAGLVVPGRRAVHAELVLR